MILGFADAETEAIYNGSGGKSVRRLLPKELWPLARRKLDRVNAAADVKDLRDPPGNRLESLKGDLAGFFSIRINDQYRIVFRFSGGNAAEVRIADYH
jgi:proteic killer suppression protein